MRRRFVVIPATILIGLTVVWLIVRGVSDSQFWDTCNQIEPGMDYATVVEMMGRKPDVSHCGAGEPIQWIYWYKSGGGFVAIQFEEKRVVCKDVYQDDDRRGLSRWLSIVPSSPPTRSPSVSGL